MSRFESSGTSTSRAAAFVKSKLLPKTWISSSAAIAVAIGLQEGDRHRDANQVYDRMLFHAKVTVNILNIMEMYLILIQVLESLLGLTARQMPLRIETKRISISEALYLSLRAIRVDNHF